MGAKAPRPAPKGDKPPATPPAPPPKKRDDWGLLGIARVKGGGSIEDLIERTISKLKGE